jgi:hypothetical protein
MLSPIIIERCVCVCIVILSLLLKRKLMLKELSIIEHFPWWSILGRL